MKRHSEGPLQPYSGLKALWRGKPTEFISYIRTTDEGEVWLILPLATYSPINTTALFRPGDTLTQLPRP
jgi:hypothetical protein